MAAGWFGIDSSNHDFSQRRAWGKNIFTNAAPISIAQYLSLELGQHPVEVYADVVDKKVVTKHRKRAWREVIDADPTDCRFNFESKYDGYKNFTRGEPDKSDVVILGSDGTHRRALEIKLTAVPDNTTVRSEHDKQSCEIVARPSTIEQLAYSICETFARGGGRHELNEIFLRHIPNPQSFPWADGTKLLGKLESIYAFLTDIISHERENQIPAVLNVIWRTDGSRPVLEEEAFDVFVWTNFAFLALFMDRRGSSVKRRTITRPERSLIWLTRMLYDYSVQQHFSRMEITRDITLGTQTDKAGSFAGTRTLGYLNSAELQRPRVTTASLRDIMSDESLAFLAPERRLDAAIYISENLL